jgi:hypothetical protein
MSGSLLGFGAFFLLIGGAIYLMWPPSRRNKHSEQDGGDSGGVAGGWLGDTYTHSDSSNHGGADSGGSGGDGGGGSGHD